MCRLPAYIDDADDDGTLVVLFVIRKFLSKLSIEPSDDDETIGQVEFCGIIFARADKIRICSSSACLRDLNKNINQGFEI